MRILVSVCLLSTALLMSECLLAAGEDIPGVTDDAVRIGMIADLTGPLASIGQEASAGVRLYLRHINDQGGVHGRKLELIVEDDGYQPPRTIAAFRKLVDRDRVFCFVGNVGSSTTMATFPLLQQEQIPLLLPLAPNSMMYTPPRRYVFSLEPAYAIQAWIILKYILDIEGAESPRLAVLYQDDDYGNDGLRGLREAAAYHELPIVAETSYRAGSVNFSTQVLNLKQSGATHVVLWTVIRETAAVLRQAQQLGWHPRFIGGAPTADERVIELAGVASHGFKAVRAIEFWSDAGKARQYHHLIRRYDPGFRPRYYHAVGFGIAQTLVEGLKRAGPDLTREDLVDAMEGFREWDEWLGPPLTYGPNLRGGMNTSAFVARADTTEMRFMPVTDWIHLEMPEQRTREGVE